jgi:Tol biopolymer transport system component
MHALLLIAAAVFGWLPAQPAPAPPPGTDVYLVSLAAGLPSMKTAVPLPVAIVPGYDNQPMFGAGAARLLITANRDGKQMDIYAFDRTARTLARVTATPEGEYSPTYLPEGVGAAGGFSAIRTESDGSQRLWRFDAQGRNPQLVLADVKPVGYHAWIDADQLALFVLGQPATLQLARVSTGDAEVVARDIGRSLHRVPGTRTVSFVQKEASGEYWVKTIDADTRAIQPLVRAVDGSSDRDCAWMPDGRTLLMSAGTKVWSWTRGDRGWSEVFDGAPRRLGAISRLAVSPDGDAVAIVTAEPKG